MAWREMWNMMVVGMTVLVVIVIIMVAEVVMYTVLDGHDSDDGDDDDIDQDADSGGLFFSIIDYKHEILLVIIFY